MSSAPAPDGSAGVAAARRARGRGERVLFVLPPRSSLAELEAHGQLERFLRHYVAAYAERGLEVGVLSCGARAGEVARVAGHPVSCVVAPRRAAGWLWLALAPLLHARLARRFGVWRATQATAAPALVLAGACHGARTIATYGYDYVRFARGAGHRLRARLLRHLLRVLLPRLDRVIVTSAAVRRAALAAGAREPSLRTIENAAPVAADPSGERAPRSVAWIGRIVPEKRLDLAVEAAERAGAALTVVGPGDVEPALRSRVESSGGRVLGSLPHEQVLGVLDGAEAFLLTSDYEGTPKAVVEALARGTAAVVPDLPELSWLVRAPEAPVAAFAPGDAGDAARVLREVLDRPQRRLALASAGHRLASERFDLRGTVEREVELALELASTPRRVLAVPKGPLRIASSRYRVHALVPELERRGVRVTVLRPRLLRVSLPRRLAGAAGEIVQTLLSPPDVLLLQRPGRRREDALLARLARLRRARVVVDLDDPIDTSLPTTRRCLELADRVVIGSETLRSGLPEDLAAEIRVRPTPLPLAPYGRAARGRSAPAWPVLGWIGDGPSHAALLARLLADAAASPALAPHRPTVRLVGVRAGDLPGPPPDGLAVELVPSLPWEDEDSLALACAAFAVGLAPYRGRGGVAFKVLQYMAAGALPLVDRSSPGLVFLEGLDPAERSPLTTDFAEPARWCRDAAALLALAAGPEGAALGGSVRRAAEAFAPASLAEELLRW